MGKLSIWLMARLSEKSTKTALLGLLYVILSHINIIPKDVLDALSVFLTTLLISSAVTKD